MAFDEMIDRSGAEVLIPVETGQEIISNLTDNFWLMKLARRLPNLSVKTREIPVLASKPIVGPVAGEPGLKPTTSISWEGIKLVAEEVAAVVPIPLAVLDDARGGGYDIWGQLRPEIEEGFSVWLAQAILYGTEIFASWSTNLGGAGLVARATTASQVVSLADFADFYEAFEGENAEGAANGMLMLLEADGVQPTASIGHPSIKGAIRNCRDSHGQRIYLTPDELGGQSVVYPIDGSIDAAQGLLITGDWSKLVYSFRQDITYSMHEDGVISDPAGTIIHNLMMDNMAALRCVLRIAWAAPNPVSRIQPTAALRCPWSVLTA